MKKTISRIIDIALILLIIYLSFRLLQKKGIIETKLDKLDKLPSFKVEDMEDKKITEKIFEDYDFTIVNIWSPLCGACTDQLKALKELEAYIEEENGNIIGMITNGSLDNARAKIDELDLNFTNLMPDKELNKEMVKGAVVTPTTLFVDKNGYIMEKHTGSYGKEGDIKFLKGKIDQLIK